MVILVFEMALSCLFFLAPYAAMALVSVMAGLVVVALLDRSSMRSPHTSACVLVLGDLGRSPRMQYHVLSLAARYPRVDVVATAGTAPLAAIREDKRIFVHSIPAAAALPKSAPRALFLLYAPFKVIYQTLALLLVLLLRLPPPRVLLMQNPPAIPALPVAWLICRLRAARLVVDWHNYGYTILALTLGAKHPLVKFARAIERVFGKRADAALCVTDAMRNDLAENWGIGNAVTLYDRPPPMFTRVKLPVAHELFTRLAAALPAGSLDAFEGQVELPAGATEANALTYRDNTDAADTTTTTVNSSNHGKGKVRQRCDRPALVVSGTSWTPDEDFGVMLEALRKYDQEKRTNPDSASMANLLVIVTGKGPLRAQFERTMRESPLRHVRVLTAWLAIEDYPRLLGSADCGVSLHTSSSGLDLPMKVVDMFGCQLP